MVYKKGPGDRVFSATLVLILLFVIIVTLYPVIYVISMSISDPQAALRGDVLLWPKGFSLQAFDVVFANKDIRFLYKGIIINHNKKPSQPTLKRRFFKKKAAFFHGPVWERSGADFILKRKGEFF